MAKDKTPKQKNKPEEKTDDLFVEISGATNTIPKILTSAELHEEFIKINDDFRKWALTQTEKWEKVMLEHRNSIVESIPQALEEKIKPTINNQERYFMSLDQEVSALKLDHEHEASAKTV